MKTPRLLIAGNPESFHVGAHFYEAAQALGLQVRICDVRQAFAAPRWIARANWHLRGHRPARLGPFSDLLLQACRDFEPDWLLATGLAPITGKALTAIGKLGVKRLNYLTDDPWNPVHRANWFLSALPNYDTVFSPRQSNLADLRAHGCRHVSYVPFAYSPSQHAAAVTAGPALASEIVFAGGADADRLPSISALIAAGFRVALYGGYWDRHPETRPFHRGHASPETLCQATAAAKIALCLVRRANRDGHVMRSFEIPAIGACMLVEDTAEHRAIFGAAGETVTYFGSIPEMVEKARWLLAHDDERRRLSAQAHARITTGRNTYQDRLAGMLGLPVEQNENRYSRPRTLSRV